MIFFFRILCQATSNNEKYDIDDDGQYDKILFFLQ